MLYVDGMEGVIQHIDTVRWLYTLIASKVCILQAYVCLLRCEELCSSETSRLDLDLIFITHERDTFIVSLIETLRVRLNVVSVNVGVV